MAGFQKGRMAILPLQSCHSAILQFHSVTKGINAIWRARLIAVCSFR